MLSRENNELITRIGPGTPMGEAMRHRIHGAGDGHRQPGRGRRQTKIADFGAPGPRPGDGPDGGDGWRRESALRPRAAVGPTPPATSS